MKVEFVRSDERHCLVRVRRSDGAVLESVQPAKGPVPHDLQHFIVEHAVEQESGLWGRIEAGAEFTSFTVDTGGPRRKPRAHNRLLTRGMTGWDEHIIAVVEAIYRYAVSLGWCPPDPLPQPVEVAIERDLRKAAGTVPAHVTPAHVTKACVDLWEAEAEWAELPVGGSLTRTWSLRKRFQSPTALKAARKRRGTR